MARLDARRRLRSPLDMWYRARMTVTWSCGVRSLPATLAGDPPIPTLAVLWTCEGFVVGASVFEGAHVTDAQLEESFAEAVARPAPGAPSARPSRIAVDSSPLARRLRKLLPDLQIDVQATPDTDDALQSLAEAMSGPDLHPMDEFMEMDESLRDAVMPAALGLFEQAPWNVLPADIPVAVSIPGCGVEEGRLSVMGHNGEVYGLMFFVSQEDFDLFAACGSGMVSPSRVVLPKCFSLNFEPIAPELVGRAPELGAFPLPLLSVFERDTRRRPSRSEVRLFLAATLGLSKLLDEIAKKGALRSELSGCYEVEVLGEALEVRLTAAPDGAAPHD